MKSFTYDCMLEGTITTLHNGVKLSTINVGTMKFTFNVLTKVSGCKFKHLVVGDKVLIHKAKSKGNYCVTIQIVDIEKKWNDILRLDTKYSIDHNLDISDNVIRPEIITPSLSTISIDKIKQVINQTDKISDRDKKILELHLDGKTGPVIAKKVKTITARQCDRIIKKYRELFK